MKQKNWMSIVLDFAMICKAKMIFAMIFAIISVVGGFLPFLGINQLLQLAIEEKLTSEKVLAIGLFCAIGFLVQVVGYMISTTFAHISAYTILEQIRLKMAERLLHAPLGEVLSRPIGMIKDIFLDKVGTIELPLAHVIPEVGASLLLPIVMFVYLISIDWRMALATLGTLPVCMLPMMNPKAQKEFNEKYAAYMKANDHVNNIIVEYIEGIEVVKTFHQTAASYEKYAGAVIGFKDFTMAWFRSSWKGLTLMSSVMPTTLLFSVPVGTWLTIKGDINIAEFLMCCILALALIAPLIKFTTYINMGKSIEYAILSANEILAIEKLPQVKEVNMPKEYDICFQDVSFSYSGEENEEVLCKINLIIPKNKVTALVGPSGGGKSTVAKLIDRFWDVSGGSITIGGVDIRKIPMEQLQKMISYVAQDNFLFRCSLKENIRLGKIDATDEEVMAAAKAAQCEEFVSRLEKGWDTPAGEAGKYLSGGEKQRIALARAILKDAPIIILDEATAFTDPENEGKIQQAIGHLAKNKTLLVIAHRLSTIKDADQIVVLEKGKIVDSGKQKELLERCSLYKSMWDAHVGAKQWAVSAKRKESMEDVSND